MQERKVNKSLVSASHLSNLFLPERSKDTSETLSKCLSQFFSLIYYLYFHLTLFSLKTELLKLRHQVLCSIENHFHEQQGRQGEGLSLGLPLPFHIHLLQGPSTFCSPHTNCQHHILIPLSLFYLVPFKLCLQARYITLKSKRPKEIETWFLMGM